MHDEANRASVIGRFGAAQRNTAPEGGLDGGVVPVVRWPHIVDNDVDGIERGDQSGR